jgi:hypothetical protein
MTIPATFEHPPIEFHRLIDWHPQRNLFWTISLPDRKPLLAETEHFLTLGELTEVRLYVLLA